MNSHRCFHLLFVVLLIAQPLLKPSTALRARAAERGNLSVPPASTSATEAAARSMVDANYGKLPLNFEINRGQAHPEVKFLARAGSSALLLKNDEAVLLLSKAPSEKTVKPKRSQSAIHNPQS